MHGNAFFKAEISWGIKKTAAFEKRMMKAGGASLNGNP